MKDTASVHSIGIVTDSTADLPPALAEKLGITVVPCTVHFGHETFRDGVDLTRSAFYERLRRAISPPTTSAPPVGVFEATYRALSEKRHAIISIHTSSKFSNIYNVARLAVEHLPQLNIKVVDSGQVSMCVGFLVMAAARLAEEDNPLEQIVTTIQGMIPRLRLVATLDTLEFLHRGGRVSWVGLLIGSLLNIKPIIEVSQGEIRLLDRVRGRRNSFVRLVQHALEVGRLELAALMHADAPAAAAEVRQLFEPHMPAASILETEVGVAVGTHAGPGAVGLCLLMS